MSEVSDGRSPASLDTNIAVIIKSIEQFSFSFALSQGLGDRQFLFCVSKPPERDPKHVLKLVYLVRYQIVHLTSHG
jgi:hypothetical protein